VNDSSLRIAAVLAAAALLLAPYRAQIQAYAHRAMEAGKEKAGLLARIAAAALIVAAAWGKVPMPKLPLASSVTITVPEPSAEMRSLVEPVRARLASLPADKRAVWATTWSKAALVAQAEGATSRAVFTDTPTLRLLTATALEIAWRRIAGQQPGSVDGLRDAVETAMRTAVGLDAVPASPEVLSKYAEVARAIAWAGTGG